MAHFAEISQEGIVLRVLVVGDDQEHRGQEFLAVDLGFGGTWVQCSYNNRIRKRFPAAGYKYDATNDVFVSPQPHVGWALNENFDWVPPVPMPNDGHYYIWNNDTQTWEIDLTLEKR